MNPHLKPILTFNEQSIIIFIRNCGDDLLINDANVILSTFPFYKRNNSNIVLHCDRNRKIFLRFNRVKKTSIFIEAITPYFLSVCEVANFRV